MYYMIWGIEPDSVCMHTLNSYSCSQQQSQGPWIFYMHGKAPKGICDLCSESEKKVLVPCRQQTTSRFIPSFTSSIKSLLPLRNVHVLEKKQEKTHPSSYTTAALCIKY